MTKRTFTIIMIFGVFIIGITTSMISSMFYGYFENQIHEELKSICSVVETQLDDSDDLSFINSAGFSDTRITIIDSKGTVIADSERDFDQLENHSNREEFLKATQKGEAFSKRRSETLGENYYYYAKLLDDGSVLRVSTQAKTVWSILGEIGPMMAVIIVVMILFAVGISVGTTKKIIKPVQKLAEHLDNPEEVKVYKELQPFVNALAKQKQKQKILDKQKKQFTANFSHELKTPLTSIAGYAELIETGIAREDDIKPFANIIRKQALRLVSLSEDIIQLSQLDESDAQSIAFSSMDLYETAKKCVEALSINARLKNVEIRLHGESTFIKANGSLLEELVYNLCDNSIRYNKENGSVDVIVSKNDGKTVLTVKDTGIGIEEKYQQRIFERFFRVDKSRSKATGGTGLGLAIVKHIAEIHGADIKVDSILGVSTSICVTFPE